MISLIKNNKVKEFGDFQTPRELAFEICRLLSKFDIEPKSIVEPTCGLGNFIQASNKIFFSSEIFGFDIASQYIESAENRFIDDKNIHISQANFFEKDWKDFFETLPKPLLILGNPPWVTNSQLGILDSKNLPKKENFQQFNGLEAMTGKSNFDISEWIMIELLKSLNQQNAYLAMLCKTSVARKVLKYAWKNDIYLSNPAIYKIETEKFFNASVDACLLFGEFSLTPQKKSCNIFNDFADETSIKEIGFENNELIASVELFKKTNFLNGRSEIKWRSGVKHDCSKVMELVKKDGNFFNGFGEIVEIEDTYIYPLLKSSDIAKGVTTPRKFVILPQKKIGEDTSAIKENAPRTWEYLLSKADFLDKRGSSIYKKNPRFAIFGIGDYSFAKWKVAISGFYKHLNFKVVGIYENKPTMLDDTCYFIPCNSQIEAEKICSLLNSEFAGDFFEAFIFWDAKRPITTEILQKLSISKLENFDKLVSEFGKNEAGKRMRENHKIPEFAVQKSFNFEG